MYLAAAKRLFILNIGLVIWVPAQGRGTVEREMAAGDRVIAYILGELPADDAAALSRAAETDPALRAAIERARMLVADLRALGTDHDLYAVSLAQRAALLRIASGPEAVTSSDPPGVVRLVMTLVRDTLLGPALPGFRGGSGSRHLGFTSPAGELDLRVEPHPASGAWRVCGQVAGVDGARAVRMGSSGEGVNRDTTGYFEILTPPAADVRLEILTDAGVLEVPAFSVGNGEPGP